MGGFGDGVEFYTRAGRRYVDEMNAANTPAETMEAMNRESAAEAPCQHEGDVHFDRTICACGEMHDYCGDCGEIVGQCEHSYAERNEAYGGDVGSKADAGKARLDLLPFGALTEVAEVFTFGATKYSPRNWFGLSVSRLFAASLRHLWAWWRGEDLDPETGKSHLAHAGCCVLMILEQIRERPKYDDRPKPEPEPEPAREYDFPG